MLCGDSTRMEKMRSHKGYPSDDASDYTTATIEDHPHVVTTENGPRVLSVRQPWASLIVMGEKTVENRTWSTPYRGTLAIHAALRLDADDATTRALPRGVILGTVSLCDVVRDADSEWALPGHWHWLLDNAVMLDAPIPFTGSLGLRTLPRRIARRIG